MEQRSYPDTCYGGPTTGCLLTISLGCCLPVCGSPFTTVGFCSLVVVSCVLMVATGLSVEVCAKLRPSATFAFGDKIITINY